MSDPALGERQQSGERPVGYLRAMRAMVKDTREVAKGTLLVVFDVPGEPLAFEAGQYFWVTLLDPPYDDERGARRHFSVVTSPNERGVLGLCTRLRDSAFKQSLAQLRIGDEVDVEAPKGSFVLPQEAAEPYVFVAGGIGITVFRSMLLDIAERKLPHRVALVYSNRDRESSPFLDELVELERQIPDLRVILTMTDDQTWTGESRRLDADVLRDLLGTEFDASRFLVAGPPALVEAVTASLGTAGVAAERIASDSFSGY